MLTAQAMQRHREKQKAEAALAPRPLPDPEPPPAAVEPEPREITEARDALAVATVEVDRAENAYATSGTQDAWRLVLKSTVERDRFSVLLRQAESKHARELQARADAEKAAKQLRYQQLAEALSDAAWLASVEQLVVRSIKCERELAAINTALDTLAKTDERNGLELHRLAADLGMPTVRAKASYQARELCGAAVSDVAHAESRLPSTSAPWTATRSDYLRRTKVYAELLDRALAAGAQ